MVTKECLEVRRNVIMLSECILADGTIQQMCCTCPLREKATCEPINRGIPCSDCQRNEYV